MDGEEPREYGSARLNPAYIGEILLGNLSTKKKKEGESAAAALEIYRMKQPCDLFQAWKEKESL